MTEHNSMKEIHAIQEKIYEETKKMTQDERLKYFNNAVNELPVKYGITFNKAKKKVLVK